MYHEKCSVREYFTLCAVRLLAGTVVRSAAAESAALEQMGGTHSMNFNIHILTAGANIPAPRAETAVQMYQRACRAFRWGVLFCCSG